ncbi:uncharacterized protein DS421_13g410140 [Arachis hypogaea]|nr:uncharacterized protein DS421_13g410140 [Arachis hypogaea]
MGFSPNLHISSMCLYLPLFSSISSLLPSKKDKEAFSTASCQGHCSFRAHLTQLRRTLSHQFLVLHHRRQSLPFGSMRLWEG